MNRYRRKVDANHRVIARAFVLHGATVAHVSSDTTAGFPDFVVGYLGRTELVEVKPATKLQRHMPSAAQQEWATAWKGSAVQLVRTVDDVASLLRHWREEHEREFRAAKAFAEVAT